AGILVRRRGTYSQTLGLFPKNKKAPEGHSGAKGCKCWRSFNFRLTEPEAPEINFAGLILLTHFTPQQGHAGQHGGAEQENRARFRDRGRQGPGSLHSDHEILEAVSAAHVVESHGALV